MPRDPSRSGSVQAVTFDCWNTLLFEPDPAPAQGRRLEALLGLVAESRAEASSEAAVDALGIAWRRHIGLWERGVATGPREIAGWTLEALGLREAEPAERLAAAFAEASLAGEIRPLEGAAVTLERLADAGVRRALVCDTGYSPGRVVRQLLADAGLLELLEVLVFSDEAGVPKPHPRMFEAALEPLATAPADAVHVGDLRRTDVAGARDVGMRTVRIRHRFDDGSDLPDADLVADTHAHLRELLGLI